MRTMRIFSLIFLLSIILIELTLRVTYSDRLKRLTSIQYIPDQELGYRYLPGSEGFKKALAFTNKYKINNAGFNWDEFEVEKRAGVYRIILIGFSDAAGTDTNGPNCYARVLQKKFKENKDDIEIMNFSIDGGHRTLASIRLAYSCAEKYNPDLILIKGVVPVTEKFLFRTTYKGFQVTFYNYNESLGRAKNLIDNKLAKPSIIKTTYNYCYIFRYVCKFYLENKEHLVTKFIKKYFLKDRDFISAYVSNKVNNLDYEKRPPVITYDLNKSKKIYVKAIDSIKSLNSRLVLFNTYQLGHDLPKYLKNNKIDYIGLDIHNKPEYSFGKLNGHTNQIGHKVIAEEFYKKLRTENLIPEMYFSNK